MTIESTRPDARALQNPFRSLRHTNFRLLWTGELTRTSAQWMDQITRGFLVLELTGSGAQLALVNAVRGLPLLALGLVSGVLADRVSRKRLLLASQTINIAANVAMAVLVMTGSVAMWHVYVGAVVIGVGMSLNGPARQSALPSLVPPEDLQHAVVLNTATLNIGSAIGPAIGGVLVAVVGIGGAYGVQAAMFVLAGSLIRRIDLPHRPPAGPAPSWRASVTDGLRYLRGHPVLPHLLLLSLVPLVFVTPFRGVVPAIATQDLGLGASQTGLLMGSVGVGAVLSVVALATLPPVAHVGRAIVVCTIGYALTTIAFVASGRFWPALAAIFVGGVLQAVMRTLTQAWLLAETDDEYRGRMSSVYVVNRGMMPIGSILLGVTAPLFGTPTAVAAMAVAGSALVVLLTVGSGVLWRR